MVKITDFGLARGRDTVTLTQSNVFMGTAYYISPEQAESGRSADTRSDLYSVAIVLFEMLSGEPPFRGETAEDIVIKHMNEKVPSICRVRPDLPPEMNDFMQRALAKQPADRYTTPESLSTRLSKFKIVFARCHPSNALAETVTPNHGLTTMSRLRLRKKRPG